MKEYKFYGASSCGSVRPLKEAADKLPWLVSPLNLYDALSDGLWRLETCAPRLQDRWASSHPTWGQCSITAFIVQDFFGGEVYGIPREGGTFHCYNVIGDARFDLTSEQFGDEASSLVYDDMYPQSRDVHFAKEEKKQRYLVLKALVEGYKG